MTDQTQPLELPQAAPLMSRTGWAAFLVALITVCMLAPLLNLVVLEGSAFHLSDFAISLIGDALRDAVDPTSGATRD